MTNIAEEWATAKSNLLPISLAEYHDSYLNGFRKLPGHIDAIDQHVFEKFDDGVVEHLKDAFSEDEELNVLGIGVGNGYHEQHFLKSLSAHFSNIAMYAVEPRSEMLESFRKMMTHDDVTKNIPLQTYESTWQEFLALNGENGKPKFSLITAVMNSLYFCRDLNETMEQLLGLTKRNGVIFVELASEKSIQNQLKQQKPWLRSFSFPNTLPSIEGIVHGHGLLQFYTLPLAMDVTEIFDENSDFGNSLLDFFVLMPKFRKRAPKVVVDDVFEFWRERSVKNEDGRNIANGSEDLIVITKH